MALTFILPDLIDYAYIKLCQIEERLHKSKKH